MQIKDYMEDSTDRSIQKVAEEIEKNKEEILLLFEKRLKEQIEVPETLSRESLISVIPQQIDSLIQTLVKFSKKKTTINSLAEKHAQLRATNKVFTLEILISEFVILRDVIFETLQAKGHINVRASNIIWKFIVYSIKVAVSEFENQRMSEAEESKRNLNESKALNKRILDQALESEENEERYRTLVQGVEDYAVFTVDPQGYITSWNPGAERINGYTSQETIGNHVSMLSTEDGKLKDDVMNQLDIALIEGKYRGECPRRKKSGEVFLADVYIKPIFKNEKHLGFAKVVVDLTERKKLIQASDITKTQIIDLKSEKKQREKFVTSLSHDLRGPLSVSRASMELLGRRMESTDKNKIFVDKAIQGLDRINRMVGDLLDANKIIAGESPHLKLNNLDLVRLTRSVCEDFEVLGSEIEIHAEKEEIRGEWDGEGLRRILENLISNAIKYGDRSHPVEVTILDFGEKVSIQVHNMGEVISDEDQKYLFDQFRRTESSKRTTQGWGIGLSLVKGITEAHGGSVEVESYPIEGTTFTVNLPKQALQK